MTVRVSTTLYFTAAQEGIVTLGGYLFKEETLFLNNNLKSG